MGDQEPLDLAAYRADIDRAHTEVGDIARAGRPRWRMSVPARPDRDSDLLISTGLRRGERLADEVERLRAELAEVKAERDALLAELALHVECRVNISIGDALKLIRASESTADAPSPVTAATEAHGETTEAREG